MQQPDGTTDVFETQRPRLVRLAYRMLGSLAEAEDVVQDAWLRWQDVDHAKVESAPAFLSRIVTRLCLDVMKSARMRRESYVGSWLPEPVIEEDDGPDEDNLTLTLMLALERLSPLERAAFLLHDVFGVALNEVATTIERDPAAVRQLAARARHTFRRHALAIRSRRMKAAASPRLSLRRHAAATSMACARCWLRMSWSRPMAAARSTPSSIRLLASMPCCASMKV